MTTPNLHLLAVDDDAFLLELLQRGLSHYGIDVDTAMSAQDAAKTLTNLSPDFVLVDVNIPGMSTADLSQLVAQHASSRFLLFSAEDPSRMRRLCQNVGAHGWLSKSSSIDDLARELRKLHKKTQEVAP